MTSEKQSIFCELIKNDSINSEIFLLDFMWPGSKPKAGQFFMIKPKRSAVFLGRPISVANIESNTVRFLIARRSTGTLELAAMRSGEEAELTGPLGNTWADFLTTVENENGKPIALIGGGIGIAPLQALLCEGLKYHFDCMRRVHTPSLQGGVVDFYAGFKNDIKTEEKNALLGAACLEANNMIIATENGKDGHKGRIPDFLEPEKYAAVCACGPEPMLKAVAAKCKASRVPCFISMEKRMACGVGACLGCTVKTVNGNRRCCADGPIFRAEEVIFDE
ncbi:MAG: dihydroorotate dehydrogenase electron transfer subunit [Treponema sp.]|jgi:NAD(P)H-flavin reductase|nr:dihydroorotate dehydrogenase electron transfer subunit [Treponema sp.]